MLHIPVVPYNGDAANLMFVALGSVFWRLYYSPEKRLQKKVSAKTGVLILVILGLYWVIQCPCFWKLRDGPTPGLLAQ